MSEWATFWEVSKDPGETEEEEQMWQKGMDLHRLTKKFCLPSIDEAVEALVDHPQVCAILLVIHRYKFQLMEISCPPLQHLLMAKLWKRSCGWHSFLPSCFVVLLCRKQITCRG